MVIETVKFVIIRVVASYHIPFALKIVLLLEPEPMKEKQDTRMRLVRDRVKETPQRKIYCLDL